MCGGLEHLKIETRFRDERFESVIGECDLEDVGPQSCHLGDDVTDLEQSVNPDMSNFCLLINDKTRDK
jgi:hypothetical protein